MLIAGQPGALRPMSEEQDRRLLSTEVKRLETDDTIEIPLTAEDMLALSQAAEAAEERQAVAVRGESASARSTYLQQQYLRPDGWRLVVPASLLGITIGVALGVAADRIHTVRVETPPTATVPAESPEPPVRFRNPFDASEVFEFPPGTSDDSARESVAAMLLQRARDRQAIQEAKNSQRALSAAARTRMSRNPKIAGDLAPSRGSPPAKLDAHGLLSQGSD
jgi:hypothetical protein